MDTNQSTKTTPQDKQTASSGRTAFASGKIQRMRSKKYRSFEDAAAFAASLHLDSRKQWREYVKGDLAQLPPRPSDVPAHPDGIYKTKGWQGWRHWLGTEKIPKEHLA